MNRKQRPTRTPFAVIRSITAVVRDLEDENGWTRQNDFRRLLAELRAALKASRP